ncbi:hypothetical protein AN639_00350 [Candidatus Epulonipiscium fishelsonii]|uniref:Uncharacterized protein n=1 Tax=Candidatus Epulonipiscium fishelsonii TaxID=77094 RepID=A0ACC8XD00_9FIRM|nr:hypothetical protein AN396_05430 [Epulopiscium sp. SCG-B11WGA-EpuloA1]ONI41836.1 hypothetical protein AN639_00350 [Epulopiscium sp. SCG-B05WGA-EpuloA1]
MTKIVYLSASGNTEYLAKYLKNELSNRSEEAEVINLLKITKNMNLECDHMILMCSITAFRVSNRIIKFAKHLTNIKNVSFIAVGCNEYWVNKAATKPLIDIANKNKIPIKLNRVVAMPVNLIYKMSRQQGREVIDAADMKITQLASDIICNKVDVINIPIKSKILLGVGKIETYLAPLFGIDLKANKDCISCGICWKNCPMKNIVPSDNATPKFKFKCSMCLGCIYKCPKKAIHPRLYKFIPFKDGYNVNEYLTSTDVITTDSSKL